jgi:hypothetical protein
LPPTKFPASSHTLRGSGLSACVHFMLMGSSGILEIRPNLNAG